jgi:hypothetical protein
MQGHKADRLRKNLTQRRQDAKRRCKLRIAAKDQRETDQTQIYANTEDISANLRRFAACFFFAFLEVFCGY